MIAHPVQRMQAAHAPKIILNNQIKRDSDPTVVWMRQLMCIPSISEKIARALLNEFGSLSQLIDALRSDDFPRVRLNERTCIGKARRDKLAEYLLVMCERAI